MEPGDKKSLDFTIVQHLGTNIKQNNVTLEVEYCQHFVAGCRIAPVSQSVEQADLALWRQLPQVG